jgi:hypothetical protein
MKTLAEKIAVMQSAERGETIEVRWLRGGIAFHATDTLEPVFDWANNDYRVAPKKPREWTLLVDSSGTIHGGNKEGEKFVWINSAYTPVKVREVIEEPVVDVKHDERRDGIRREHGAQTAPPTKGGAWDWRVTLRRDTPTGTRQESTDGGATWNDVT